MSQWGVEARASIGLSPTLHEEHDISLVWPPLLLVGQPRVDDHVSVVEQHRVELRDGAELCQGSNSMVNIYSSFGLNSSYK